MQSAIDSMKIVIDKAERQITVIKREHPHNHDGNSAEESTKKFLESYYSIIEELRNVVRNKARGHFELDIDNAITKSNNIYDNTFGNARNLAVHQGKICSEDDVFWEVDVMNDTSHPVRDPKVTIFLDKNKKSTLYYRDILIEMERVFACISGELKAIYNKKTGLDYDLPAANDLF